MTGWQRGCGKVHDGVCMQEERMGICDDCGRAVTVQGRRAVAVDGLRGLIELLVSGAVEALVCPTCGQPRSAT